LRNLLLRFYEGTGSGAKMVEAKPAKDRFFGGGELRTKKSDRRAAFGSGDPAESYRLGEFSIYTSNRIRTTIFSTMFSN